MLLKPLVIALSAVTLVACGGGGETTTITPEPVIPAPDPIVLASNDLEALLVDPSSFTMPSDGDYDSIPQDPNNKITDSKVELGKFLYHETAVTAFSLTGMDNKFSCASCHSAKAGFKSGNAQGIGDGGVAYGMAGEMRMANMMLDDLSLVDHQPLASPTTLNIAYQDVMLWNGQFGNAAGSVNATVDPNALLTTGTPKANNELGYSGVETQAIAGITVHRLGMGENSIVSSNPVYVELVERVRAENEDVQGLDLHTLSALSIAAYERTLLANQSPFQQWLRGDKTAMTESQLEGAKLFFGKAECSACHNGPALSSRVGATVDEMFMSLGFADLDAYNVVHSDIPFDDASRLGRGGLTGNPEDNYKFKIPPLYNLAMSGFLGHGNSFNSVRAVVEYKNAGIPENPNAENIDPRFRPLNLSAVEVDNLVSFIEEALLDPNLDRYVPTELPSGQCIINNDDQSRIDLGCD